MNALNIKLQKHLEDFQKWISQAYLIEFTIPDHPKLPAICLPDDESTLKLIKTYLKNNSVLKLYTWIGEDEENFLLKGAFLGDEFCLSLCLLDSETLVDYFANPNPERIEVCEEPKSN